MIIFLFEVSLFQLRLLVLRRRLGRFYGELRLYNSAFMFKLSFLFDIVVQAPNSING